MKVKKAEYAEKIKHHKEKIDEINSAIRTIEKEVLKNNELSNYGRLSIANSDLNIIAIYCTMSDISMALLGIKNEAFLNEARKLLYKMLSILQEIAGSEIDASLTENEDKLKTIDKLDDHKRLNLFKKILDAVRTVEEKFGEKSKWRWSFVDLFADAAVAVKNMVDYKKLQTLQRDPRNEGYADRNEILRFVKDQLKTAATRYREKYEMVTHEPIEMKKALQLLGALYRVNILFNEGNDADNTRKNIAIWQEKFDADLRKAEEDKKKKQK
jgi:hypothetical protein